MRLGKLLLGIAATVAAASPASAELITYTLTGNTASGAPFTIVGSGDTTAVFAFGGDFSIPTVPLTSNSITIGASSGSITGDLYFFNNQSVSIAGYNLNLGGDIFDFSNIAFASYDAVSALGPLSVSPSFSNLFTTSFGDVDLANSTNLTFEAVVGQDVIPEPATWAMFLLGFAATGAAVRRSRKAGAPALA